MTTQAEFFDSYADRWDSMECTDIRARLDRVVGQAQVRPGMDILDVGTGTGVLIPSLLRAMGYTGRITAIDISQRMLDVARAKGFPRCVTLQLADIEECDRPDSSFDRVMCNSVFPHFSNKESVLTRMRRMLKPGGLLVISHPIGRDAVNKIHSEASDVVTEDRVPDAQSMAAMLEAAGFTKIRVTDEPEFYLAIAARPPGPA